MPMRAVSRREAIEAFAFELERDFKGPDGEAPTWASRYPKQWGSEDDRIVFELQGDGEPVEEIDRRHIATALSPDQKLLAVSNGKGVMIYDIRNKEKTQVIRNGDAEVQRLWFAGVPQTAHDTEPQDVTPASEKRRTVGPEYVLFCARSHPSGSTSSIILYDLAPSGRLMDQHEALDARDLASKAVGAISRELIDHYEWSEDDIRSLGLADSVSEVLSAADAKHSTKHRTVVEGGPATFADNPFDTAGGRMLYTIQNKSTQGGMRTAERLPHVIVYDVQQQREIMRLSGHTDAIMWTGFSPDDSYIASVAWDDSLRMYHAASGELAWSTESGGGQAWCAAFSPDLKHILLSSGNGRKLSLLAVQDGAKVAEFNKVDLHDWVRNIVWHPSEMLVAFACGTEVFVWQPLEGPGGQLKQTIGLAHGDNRLLARMLRLEVQWLESGRKLMAMCSDGTVELWDSEENKKWRMLRPRGKLVGSVTRPRYLLRSDTAGRVLLSIDGDGVARFWVL